VSYISPYYTIQDKFASSTGTAHTRGLFRWPRYPRYTKVARRSLVVLLNHHQYNTYIGTIPGPNSVQASRSERLILPAKCGACVQHDKKAINDWSLINTGRPTMVQHPITLCSDSVSFPHLVIFHGSIKQLNLFGNHLYLAGDRKSPHFYRARQAKHRLRPTLLRTG